MLRRLAYLFLIIFFIMGAIAAYTFVVTINKAEGITQPVGEFVQQLMIPATPVILPNPATIVREINDLARLETASVNLEKIVTAERNNDYLWGAMGETLIFVANGTVVAGVDLADMTPADLQVVDPTTVMIHLPSAALFDDLPALNNENSYVADRDTGLLARADPQLETEVRRLAESVLIEEALNTGVLDQANFNAQQFMLTFMQGLGFETVIFTDETPPTVEPFEQEIPKGYVLTTPTPQP